MNITSETITKDIKDAMQKPSPRAKPGSIAAEIARLFWLALHPCENPPMVKTVVKSRGLADILFNPNKEKTFPGLRTQTFAERRIDGVLSFADFSEKRKEQARSAALKNALAGEVEKRCDAFRREAAGMVKSGKAFDEMGSFRNLCEKFTDDLAALIGG
jgi:hypothetical protein